jgi:hypothetical protein
VVELQKWAEQGNGANDLSAFSPMELLAIKDDASSALVHTQTEETFAKALVEEYARVLK